MGTIRKRHVAVATQNAAYQAVLDLIGDTTSPSEIVRICEAEAKRLGLRIEHKSSPGNWSRLTTTFYSTIYLGTRYREYDDVDRAILWTHEMVHVYQWRQMGRFKFSRRYILAPYRWAVEMVGFRMSVYMRRRLGVSKADNRDYILRLPARLNSIYKLGRIKSKSLRDETVDILMPLLD